MCREEWICWQQQNNDGVIAEGRRWGMQICHSAKSCWCEGDDNLHSLGTISRKAKGNDGCLGIKKFTPFLNETPTMGAYSKVVLWLPVFLESELQEWNTCVEITDRQSADLLFSPMTAAKKNTFNLKIRLSNVVFMVQLLQKHALLSNGLAPPIKFTWIIEHNHPNRTAICFWLITDQLYQRLSQGWRKDPDAKLLPVALMPQHTPRFMGVKLKYTSLSSVKKPENSVFWQVMKEMFSHLSNINIVVLKKPGLKHTAL